ncbi:MAG TPA: hypothetical protein VNB22_09610 [Pyrinomonadaceae bacterium]|nr:hypothetical protein [Pyrinomonadaceae bacterium]
MRSKKLNLFVLASFCLGLIALVLPAVSNAQGRYANKYTKRDVSSIITRLEESSNTFRREFDRNLDNSSINGTNEEDRLNRIVQNYERALNRLRRDFDSSDNWWQSRNNVQDVMSEARQVNVMMNNLQFARKLERQWNQMRRDINKLADTYDLPDLAGGGYGGGGGGGGNAPNWAIGTFYGRNPQTGGTIVMTVTGNGSVTFTFENGQANYATLNGDRLNNNGVISRITKLNNGVRTTRIDNGERIDYYANGGGGGGGDDTGGNVPSWAIGRFYGRNPQTGGTITLDINSNGSVVVTFENGATNYATINGDRLTNNGVVSRVTRINNGIRTTRLDNGERIDYRR